LEEKYTKYNQGRRQKGGGAGRRWGGGGGGGKGNGKKDRKIAKSSEK